MEFKYVCVHLPTGKIHKRVANYEIDNDGSRIGPQLARKLFLEDLNHWNYLSYIRWQAGQKAKFLQEFDWLYVEVRNDP